MRTRWLDVAGFATLCVIAGAGSALAQSGTPPLQPLPNTGSSVSGVPVAPGPARPDMRGQSGPTSVPLAPGPSGSGISGGTRTPSGVPVAPGPAGNTGSTFPR